MGEGCHKGRGQQINQCLLYAMTLTEKHPRHAWTGEHLTYNASLMRCNIPHQN